MSRKKVNKIPNRQRRDNHCAQNCHKPSSFKLTGLIVLCVFGFLLFGFSPRAGASPSSPVEQFITGIGQTIHNVTEAIANHL